MSVTLERPFEDDAAEAEEQLTVLMKMVGGKSLKTESVLWGHYTHLRKARNTFVHSAADRDSFAENEKAPQLREASTFFVECRGIEPLTSRVRLWIGQGTSTGCSRNRSAAFPSSSIFEEKLGNDWDHSRSRQ